MYSDVIRFIRDRFHSPAGNFLPLHPPTFIGNEKRYLEECIDSTYVSSVGPFVDRFEKEVAAYTGAAAAVVTVNGTSALHMALILSGVGNGDIVLTQALTFIATCNAIAYTGAEPVFIDVDPDTMGLSPEALRRWLEENAEKGPDGTHDKLTGQRIKAAVVMHTFGHPARIDLLLEVCQEWGIELIEDAAESIGSLYKGKHTGTFANIGALSFNGNKTITTGGGGMLLFKDTDLAKRAKHLTTQAKMPHRWEFVHDEVGYNYRMPNINAALGCAQLENIDRFIENKRATATSYREYFKNEPEGIKFMTEPSESRSNYWLCAVKLPDRASRDRFLTQTNDHGVMTRPIWELMCRLPMWKNSRTDGLHNTIELADTVVNIPSGVTL